MISFFPELYPDELVYSACSRYHARAGYRSRISTSNDLFGVERAKVAIDLPSGLETLIAAFPRTNWQEADRLIDEHTLLPFYGPFLPPERLRRLRANMRFNRGGAIHAPLGMLTSGVGSVYLRFCPKCVDADRERFDETYWHRLHHAPGVEVCPIHRIFLEGTAVHARHRIFRDAFVTAEQAVYTVTTRAVDDADPDHAACLRIAQNAAWLLSQRGLTSEPNVIRNRYLRLLFDRGLATYAGSVFTAKLHDAFRNFYSADLLRSLKCGLERRATWLTRIVQTPKGAQPPLQHLLLMGFLECTAESFFSLPGKSAKPFGEGPWPCLNRASAHFGEPRISKCEIRKIRVGSQRRKKMGGIFRCDCGFAYSRKGPDRTPADRHQFHQIKSYGEVWYATLGRLRDCEGLLQKEIAARLGVSYGLVQKQLNALRSLRRSATTGAGEVPLKYARQFGTNMVRSASQLLEPYRKAWLQATRDNPEASRSELRRDLPAIYVWLICHDKEWFEANSPPRRKSVGRPSLIDWEKRDIHLAREAKAAAARIIGAAGRPVRASANRIAMDIGAHSAISKRGHLLPLTVKAISETAETPEAYAIRRIRWAAECFKQEKVIPTPSRLQIRAGASPRMLEKADVSKALADAAQSLRELETAEIGFVDNFNVTEVALPPAFAV